MNRQETKSTAERQLLNLNDRQAEQVDSMIMATLLKMVYLSIFGKTQFAMETNPLDFIEEYQSEDIMSLNHSKLIHRLSVALDRYEDAYDILPELELDLSTGKCKPDIAVYQKLHIDWLNDVIFYNQPPIVAVEILSPKQALTDLTDKAYK